MNMSLEGKKPHIEPLWTPGEGYSHHRIPGMTITAAGTLLLYHEARRESHDWAVMDILMERSERSSRSSRSSRQVDGGFSPSAPVGLARGTDVHPTVNNPVMVQDKEGTLHFLYCEDYSIRGGRVLHRLSRDDGKTWSAPSDITADTRPESRNAFALGPGHGICTSTGRLIFPVWLVLRSAGAPEDAHGPSVVGTLYSDDNGRTWALGELLPAQPGVDSPSEAQIAETEDGIYMNVRCMNGYRAAALSKDGIRGWTPLTPVTQLVDPGCFASLLATTGADGRRALWLVHCDHPEDRIRVTLRLSEDGGRTWPSTADQLLMIDEARGGYPALAFDSVLQRLYIVYEDDYGRAAYLATVSLE